MPGRCALGCVGRGVHRFPNPEKFPGQFRAWVQLMGGKLETPEDYIQYRNKRICNIHFTEKHMNRNNRLNAIAVPSLHLPAWCILPQPMDSNAVAKSSSSLATLLETGKTVQPCGVIPAGLDSPTSCCTKVNIEKGSVCSVHFLPADFDRPLRNVLMIEGAPRNYRNLKPDAVPSLHINENVQPSPTSVQVTEKRLPKDPDTLKTWTKAVGIKNCGPQNNYTICSEHFMEESIIETKQGPKIHVGALPRRRQNQSTLDAIDCSAESEPSHHTISPIPELSQKLMDITFIQKHKVVCVPEECLKHIPLDTSKDAAISELGPSEVPVGTQKYHEQNLDVAAELMVCRICLAVDSNMHNIREFHQVYKLITGLSASDGDAGRLPQRLCWECAARLTAASALRDKALLSDVLLRDLLKPDTFIRLRDIKTINRKSYGLKSSLGQTLFDSEHFDVKIQDTFIETDHVESDTPDLDIKYDPEDGIPEILQDDPETEEITDIYQNDNVENNVKTFMLQNDNDNLNESLQNDVTTEELHQNEDEKRQIKTVIMQNDNTDDNVKYVMLQNDNNVKYVMLQNKNIESNVKYVMLKNDGDENNLKYVMLENGGDDGNDKPFVVQNDYYNMETGETFVIIQDRNTKHKELLKRVRFHKQESNEEISMPKMVKKVMLKPKKVTQNKSVVKVQKSRAKKKDNADTASGQHPSNKKILIDESLFKITMLTYNQQKEEMLERQEKPSYTHALFKCTVCFSGFQNKAAYERHVQKHTDIHGLYECCICKIRKKRKSILNKHLSQQHTREYQCLKCDFVTRHRNPAVEHMRYHAGYKYHCKQCPRVFDKRTSYFSHLHQRHKSSSVCLFCGFTFVSKIGLTAHQTRQHKLEKHLELKGPYCKECDVTFLSQDAFDRHLSLSSKHTENESDPSFQIRNDHEYSARRHRHEPLSCEQCDQVLRNYKTYAIHFKNVHPGQSPTEFPQQLTTHMCEQCGAMFSTLTALKSHKWVHKGPKPYQCDHCPKSFSQIPRLVAHINDHRRVQPKNKCPHCEKFFVTGSSLKKHLFNHTGQKPYICDFCGKNFSTTDRVRSHIQHVHFKKPWPRKAKQSANRELLRF